MTIVDTPERRQLRELTRAFVTREVLPHLADWERAGEVPRSLHATAAKVGLLGIGFPESVGGSGGDLLDSIIGDRGDHPLGRLVRADRGAVHARHRAAAHGRRRRRRPRLLGGRLAAGPDDDLIDRYVRPTLAGDDDRRAGDHRAGRRLRRGRASAPPPAGTATTTS